jgi:hypothetical protein
MDNLHSLRTTSGRRQTFAPPAQVFFLAAIRIPSHTHPLLCGYSASYKRHLSASIRHLSASMRQLSASIWRGSETDPARYAARFGSSETASREIRQIEHLKIPQKGTFGLKAAPKKFGRGLLTRSQMWVAAGLSLRQLWLSRESLSPPLSPSINAASNLSLPNYLCRAGIKTGNALPSNFHARPGFRSSGKNTVGCRGLGKPLGQQV